MASINVSSSEKDPRRLADAIRQLVEGKSNAVGKFTLTANATSTVVQSPTCSPSSFVFLSPITQNASNDMATTSIVCGMSSFTVTHANNARVDRTFGYVVLG